MEIEKKCILENKIITLEGEILENYKDVKKFESFLKTIKYNEYFIVELSTPGGSNPDAVKMMQRIINYPNAKCTVTEYAHSAGIILLTGFALENRQAKKQSLFRFHYPTFKDKTTPIERQKNQTRNIQEWISRRTKMHPDYVNYLMKNEIQLDAIKAKKHGLISSIV